MRIWGGGGGGEVCVYARDHSEDGQILSDPSTGGVSASPNFVSHSAQTSSSLGWLSF